MIQYNLLPNFQFLLLISIMNSKGKLGDMIKSKIKEHSRHKSNFIHQDSTGSSASVIDINYSYGQSIKFQKTSKIRNSQGIPNRQPIQPQQKIHNSQSLDSNNFTDQIKASINANRIRQFSSARNLELDPRDQRILIPFQSLYYNLLEQSNFFISFQPFKDQILDWLIDIIQIVTSISFNHLKKQTLSDVEAKAFAAKNILLNIKDLYEKYPKIPLQRRVQLMTFINESAQSIFQKIIHKYPQSSSRGASKRVKSRITAINNRQSDEFDFLLKNNIHITYREDGDYSESIMKIINKLVSYTNQVFDPNDEFQETNFQVFTEIMEYIFQNCNSQSVSNISQQIAGIINRKRNPDQNYLSQLNGAFAQHLTSWGEVIRDEQSKKNSSFIKDSHKTFLIGHKIPSGTRLFSQEDINGSIFKIHDSSILRLLTKWAEELKQKLANPQESIYRRLYKFKNSNGKLVNLEVDLKSLLYEATIEEYKKINEYFNMLKSENIYLQTLFAEELNKSKYSKNDIKIDLFAAKINKISGHYIFQYINKMIHSLLTISKLASEKAENEHDRLLLQSVNLVTFKIGDLMRSKCACSEQQFIKILSVIDQINQRYPDFLKIVRIKNRLEMQNNDILINLFFMNKVQCELQLSITGKSDKNQKKSNQFQHFLYQIIRSQMGPISQLSITLAQYDPMINVLCKEESFTNQSFSAETIQKNHRCYLDKVEQRIRVRSMLNLKFNIELPFICCHCQKLCIIYNPKFLWRDPNSLKRLCNDCRLQQIKDAQLQGKMQQPLQDHLINSNFNKQSEKMFYKSHFCFWDACRFIKILQDTPEDQVSTQWIPRRGFMIKANQKKPKLQLFTSLYETVSQYVKFANKAQNGQVKLLSKIPVHCDKKKRIQIFKTELFKFFIFKLVDIKQIVQDGYLYFKCQKKGCCGFTVRAGVNLSFEEMVVLTHNYIIEYFIDNRKSVLYLNSIPQSFDKLQKKLAKYEQGPKLKIISNRIQAIEAYSCSLDNINLVKTFSNLFQLNISCNPQLKSLKGLENCTQLRFLNCKQCNIYHLNELSNLFKLQYLNIGLNKNLRCLKGIQKHSQLIELYMEGSQITNLDALSQCPKLQTLDIQSCTCVKSLEPIKSLKLTYLNIIDCVGLQKFNLPIQSMKSLKTVDILKKSILEKTSPQYMAYNLIYSSLKMLDKSDATFEETIQKINSILLMKKTNSIQLMIS